jgi:hypothetical protein
MTRVETLKEQIELLRRLATTFDTPSIKQDLLKLADRCECLAAKIASEPRDPRHTPIDELATSDST